jgi:predicted glycosyl hydrolase (DUF1957 family)
MQGLVTPWEPGRAKLRWLALIILARMFIDNDNHKVNLFVTQNRRHKHVMDKFDVELFF